MRNFAVSIYITAPITVIAFTAAMLLHFCASGTDAAFWCNVCLGIFGSGLVTVLVSCVGYASEKKKTMEGFYINTLGILRVLSRYDKTWERDRKLDFLIDYSDMNRYSWDTYYGDMCLLFDFSRERIKYIYEKIYLPIFKFNEQVECKAYHFKLYKDGDANNSIIIDKMIAEIESMLIMEERQTIESDNGPFTITNVKYILTNPVIEELDGRYYELMYRKSQRKGK